MFSHFFIDRPIFAMVVSLIIVIAGAAAMVSLPIAQFPNITPVQIQVPATYPGADAETVAQNRITSYNVCYTKLLRLLNRSGQSS